MFSRRLKECLLLRRIKLNGKNICFCWISSCNNHLLKKASHNLAVPQTACLIRFRKDNFNVWKQLNTWEPPLSVSVQYWHCLYHCKWLLKEPKNKPYKCSQRLLCRLFLGFLFFWNFSYSLFALRVHFLIGVKWSAETWTGQILFILFQQRVLTSVTLLNQNVNWWGVNFISDL